MKPFYLFILFLPVSYLVRQVLVRNFLLPYQVIILIIQLTRTVPIDTLIQSVYLGSAEYTTLVTSIFSTYWYYK